VPNDLTPDNQELANYELQRKARKEAQRKAHEDQRK